MPVKVEKRGSEFCVVEPDGATIKGGCHSTKGDASKHAAAVNANVENKEKGHGLNFVPFGVMSFEELESVEAAMEVADKTGELTSNFQDLLWNIMNSDDVEDKPSAIRQLAGDFTDRLEVMTRRDPTKAAKRKEADLKRFRKANGDGGLVSKVVNAVIPGSKPETDLLIWKDKGGTYRFVARYSNNLRDVDNPPEIISSKSHRKFEALVDIGLVAPPKLWLWHQKELQFGQSEWVAYDDEGFALTGGRIYPEFNEFAEELKELDDVKVSHGMPRWSIQRDDADNSIITEHITEEISPLPGWAAANKRTGFVILDN